ncbi:alpha/beta hydrolase [Spirulina major CS-329]|uniref:alpha/beta fold hydrolase n=1 Tax=Spirulina TaxID=1154 RepID=UPI00232E566A|nr:MULTISPECIES: alpha/beta hydrolase [Spirulina]MDB9495004.1 alpha/beta hydrolase [Spirulina subsalsa CS-330]MDB9502617.1 alpha/beta hydrolase [Spirulina major CS-329]
METIELFGVSHTYEFTPASNPNRPVLVFIHGWLLSCEYWRPLVEELSGDYACLLYDLRGFGRSAGRGSVGSESGEQPAYTLQAYARDLMALLDHLELREVWCIGHSLGGSIALWGAKCDAQRVRGVICLNSGGGIFLKEEFERFRQAGQQIVKYRARWLTCVPGLDWVFARMMVARSLQRHWGRQRLLDFVRADRAAALGALLETTTETEVHRLPQLVARLSQPVYFLAGQQDQVMELQYVRHLASFHGCFQQQRDNVIEIPDCGHLSMVEQTPIVYRHILDILMRHHGDAGAPPAAISDPAIACEE